VLPPPATPVQSDAVASTPGGDVEGPDGSAPPGGVNKTPFIIVGVVLALVMIVGLVVAVVSDASNDESYSLEAALDNAGGASSVEYEMTVLVRDEPAFTIEGAADGDVMALSVDVGALLGADAVGSTAAVILDAGAGVLYVQANELIPSSPLDLLIPDLGWVALDIGELDLDGAEDGIDIEDALGGNPLIVIDLVDVDPSDATDLGSETIEGVDTRHYQFTVDVAASIEILDELSDLAEQFDVDIEIPEGALGEVAYDVWVTEDNQVRRVAVGFEIADERMSVVLDVLAIGGDVEIEVPSDDEVFDIGEAFDFGAILGLGELLDS
jgi:hypothetical protein